MIPELHTVLRAEILNDPASRGYAGRAPDEIAALLNSPYVVEVTPQGARDVSVGDIEGYLRSHLLVGRWKRFVASPPAGAPDQIVDGVGELLDMLTSQNVKVVRMTNPQTAAMVGGILAAIVPYGLVTAEQRDELLALAVAPAVTEERHPRWMDVAMGIEDAANVATEADVVEALA